MGDLEFTGERVVPGKVGEAFWYEHVARYLFAAQFVRGKTLLDAGCGAGYGTELLAARGARYALGIDSARDAIAYAQSHYQRSNLDYRVMSVTDMALRGKSFDLVVSFEVIEHLKVKEQEGFLAAVSRVLANDGLFIVSTPNRENHQLARSRFHRREFNLTELRHTLGRYFHKITIFGQDHLSRIAPTPVVTAATEEETAIEPSRGATLSPPRQFIVICEEAQQGKRDRAPAWVQLREDAGDRPPAMARGRGIHGADRARPVISVAIATRNYGHYLPRALDSVFRCHNPTHAPLQVVVVDDASTDNTRAILADYRQRYPESLEIVSIRTPAGLGAAKNAALDRCLGRTVALLDADDEFLPKKLARCHAALEQGGVDIVTHDFQEVEDGQVTLRNRRTWPHFPPPSTWVFRNGVVRFNPLAAAAEDLEWIGRRWRLQRHAHLDRPLSVLHLHGGQLSKTWDTVAPSRQVGKWMAGRSCEIDRLAPSVWCCRTCGNQYLLPSRCCGRDAFPRPLLFYIPGLSPHSRAQALFSLVMLTRNALHLTRRAVDSLLARLPIGRRHQVEWIFVDGGSTDGTLEYLREMARTIPLKLILTHPEEPFNYARACNRGVRAAVGEYVLVLHNDIELEGEDPWEAVAAALRDERVGVVGASTVWSAPQQDAAWGEGEEPYRLVDRPVTEAFWGARREVYWELGGMDDAFMGYGCEELDFQYRAQKAHYYLAQARVGVRHAGHGTMGALYGGAALQRLAAQNRQRFAEKHGEGVFTAGGRVEPFAGRGWAKESVVIVAGEEAAGLRGSLARAERDGECRAGRVQVVVVENASGDETARVVEEYRERLARCLTRVVMGDGVGRAEAERKGKARAIGERVRVVAPGEW